MMSFRYAKVIIYIPFKFWKRNSPDIANRNKILFYKNLFAPLICEVIVKLNNIMSDNLKTRNVYTIHKAVTQSN